MDDNGKVESYFQRAMAGLGTRLAKTLCSWRMARDRSESLKAYYSKLAELLIEEGCLLWGGHVIILRILREKVKAELHKGSPK